MNKNGQRVLSLALLLTCLFAVMSHSASAQTVLNRMRLGSSVEGITYIPNGPYANHIAVLDSMDLIVSPADSKGVGSWKKLFDFTSLGLTLSPRGIGYIDSEKLFIFSEWSNSDLAASFLITDQKGKMIERIPFQWPDDVVSSRFYVEGVAWIPLNAPRYAGSIVFAASPRACCAPPELMVITRNGALVNRIPMPDPNWMSPLGLAYQASGRLLVGNVNDDSIWEMDLDGFVTRGPILTGLGLLEGVAALPKGEVAVTTHDLGKVVFLDANLAMTGRERTYQAGFGINGGLNAVAWKGDTNEYLVFAAEADSLHGYPNITAISSNLRSKRIALDLAPLADFVFGSIDYVGKDQLFAVSKRNPNPKEIMLFDTAGMWSSSILLGTAPTDRVIALAYVASTDQFAIVRIGPNKRFDIVDRTGLVVRTVDLTPSLGTNGIVDLAYLPGGGLMVLATQGTGRQCLRLDSAGNVLETYSMDFLKTPSLSSMKAITSGPYAGKYVGIDGSSSELIVFNLP